MKKITRIVVIGLSLSLLAVALSVFTSKPAPAQNGNAVTVVNTTARPVPTSAQGTTTVAGSVAITGTPNVNATIAGTPTVNASITNTPTVSLASGSLSNTATTPLFVRDEATAGRYPFAVKDDNIGNLNGNFGAALFLPNTPSGGGTAVIEYLSAICTVRPGIVPDFVYIFTVLGGGFQTRHIITATGNGVALSPPTAANPWTAEEWVGQPIKIYATPGSELQLLQEHDNGGCDLAVAGYLIPQ